MTIKICAIGDLHGDYEKLEEILKSTKADLYLQVGDYSVSYHKDEEYVSPSKQVFFISGNHDTFNVLEPLNPLSQNKVYEIVENLKYIPTGHYMTFKGIKIVGFGGNYSKKRFEWQRKQLHGDRRRHYTESDFERTLNLESCDILITHEPAMPFPWRGSDAGSPIITSLIHKLQPRYHFCGHMHIGRESQIGNCKSYCIPIHSYKEFEI